MSIYDRFGIPTVINGLGPVTRLGGKPLEPEITEAMRQASLACVDMFALQAGASRVIGRVTSAQAGIVTSGASAAVLLGTAACLAGLDPGRMNRLPEVPDGRRDFVVVRSQRNMYDRALLVAGARITEIGIPDRFSGPGVRDADAWEVEEAIGPQTAGIYYLAQPQSLPALPAVAEVARSRGIPLLVDAAAQLPPAANLRRYLEQGADLVAFSGGKAIGGPQSSGILCGRGDLIASALMQMLDLDIDPAGWQAPAEFAPLRQMRGLPHHGIGRSCKAGKEEIIGLLVALERFAAEPDAARAGCWRALLENIAAESGLSGLSVIADPARPEVPLLHVPAPGGTPDAADRMARLLAAGTPAVHASPAKRAEGFLIFSPVALSPDDAPAVGRALRDAAAAMTR